MVKLECVNKENLYEAIKIKVNKEQEKIIAPSIYSLAECYVYQDLKPFLIKDDSVAVGFVLMNIDKEKPIFEIARFMIDQNHQGKGYGRFGMKLAIEYLKENGAKEIELSHRVDNPFPSSLYLSLGFKYTGIIEGPEKMMKLVF